MATVSDVARHLDLSMARVGQLQLADVLPRSKGRSGLDLDECRVAYIRHLREAAAGRGDLSAERARLAREQADGQAMKNAAAARASCCRGLTSTRTVQVVFGRVRARLLAIPTKAAPLVAMMQLAAGGEGEADGIGS